MTINYLKRMADQFRQNKPKYLQKFIDFIEQDQYIKKGLKKNILPTVTKSEYQKMAERSQKRNA